MAVIRQRRHVISKNGELRELCPPISLGKGRIIPSDPKRIARINAELRKKCEEQRKNDAEAEIWAKFHGCIWTG